MEAQNIKRNYYFIGMDGGVKEILPNGSLVSINYEKLFPNRPHSIFGFQAGILRAFSRIRSLF